MIDTIYFDMDGVFCDFDKKFAELLELPEGECVNFRELPLQKFEAHISYAVFAQEFFSSLTPTESFEDLKKLFFGLAKKGYKVEMLTAIGNINFTEESMKVKYFLMGSKQKQQWLKDHGLGEYHVNFVDRGIEKHIFASPKKFLIDDTPANIEKFRESGGHGMVFTGDVDEVGVSLDKVGVKI